MSVHTVEYIVRVHEEDDATFWAEVLDLPGCFASGDTLDELREALQEAIALYLIDDPEAATIHSMQNRERSAMRIDEMRVKVLA